MEEQDFDGALKLQDALLELQQGRGRRVHQLLNPFHGRGVWREQSRGAQHGLQTLRAGPAPPEMPDAPTDGGSEDGGAAGGDAAPSADGGDASEVRSAPAATLLVCAVFWKIPHAARRRRSSSLRLVCSPTSSSSFLPCHVCLPHAPCRRSKRWRTRPTRRLRSASRAAPCR